MAVTTTSTAAQALLAAAGSFNVNQTALANALKGGLPQDTHDGLTATTSGSQTNATQLNPGMNRLATVANNTDACILPQAIPGTFVYLVNDGVDSTTVFGMALNPATNAGDTIDGVATATGNAMGAAKRAIFICLTAGAWISMAGAKIS